MSNRRALRVEPPIHAGLQLRNATAFILDPQSRHQLQNCLSRFDLENVTIEPGDVQDAIHLYSEKPSPELLFVDISGLDMPLSKLEALASVCAPDVTVIVVGDRDNVGLYRNLLKYGVSEYLVKPLPADLLYQTARKFLSDDLEEAPSLKTGKSIGVFGAVGGVGVTSLLAGMSDILTRHLHRRVMLLDLHIHDGDLGLHFGQVGHSGLLDLLNAPERVDDFFIDRSSASLGPRLDLLDAEVKPETLFDLRGDALDILFKHIHKNYHFVMLDVMKAPALQAFEILKKMDLRIIVLDRSLASLRNTNRLLAALQYEQGHAQNIMVLNNPRPVLKTDLPVSRIEEVIGQSLDFQVPYDGRNYSLSALNAVPVSQGGGKAAQSIIKIAEAMVGPVSGYRKQSVWGRLIQGGKNVWKEVR